MYLGHIVEQGPSSEVFDDPRHPYTVALLGSAPSPDPRSRGAMRVLEGDVPSAIDPPAGCRFRMDVCEHERPLPHLFGMRQIACHLPDDFDVVASGTASQR